jgi:hypothetical protein
MYFPKSKIITNLYTNGNEFIIKSNNVLYTGYYHKLYNGTFFTGKNPNDNPVNELVPVDGNSRNNLFDESLKPNENIISFSYFSTTSSFKSDDILIYNYISQKNINPLEIKKIPISYYPQPTQKEYDLGEFQRYFVKKVNELVYLEIDKDTYTAIKNRDPKYAYEYYIPFTFAWQIYGNRVDILQTNRNTVLLTEQKLKIKGLQEFLKNNYDKFYQYPVVNNLFTNGGELQRANKTEYIGPYHIEADRGFVIEAQPSSNLQSTLFTINLEIEKRLLDNALKLIGKFVYPTPIYDIIKKKK